MRIAFNAASFPKYFSFLEITGFSDSACFFGLVSFLGAVCFFDAVCFFLLSKLNREDTLIETSRGDLTRDLLR